MIIEIDKPTPSNNIWQRMHYRGRKIETQAFCLLILEQLKGRKLKPIEKCIITVTRYSSGKLDWDNFYGGLKPVLDCLVKCTTTNPHGLGVILDDNPDVVIELKGKQETAPQKKGKTKIEIEAIK